MIRTRELLSSSSGEADLRVGLLAYFLAARFLAFFLMIGFFLCGLSGWLETGV